DSQLPDQIQLEHGGETETKSADGETVGGQQETFERDLPKVGRNDPCPCGSGRKYKKCCLRKDKRAS
ncbi:MAG: SEC-C metal-binding domain-containing protein, partial [Bradymonadaceae bacterium]